MDIFIARQPIFDKKEKVKAYELLYRDADNLDRAVINDVDMATRRLVADAVTVFDIQKLANYNPAFINFGYDLLMEDFAKTLTPNQVVIDLADDVLEHEDIINKIKEYKLLGYSFSMQYRTPNELFNKLVSMVDVLMVDIQSLSYDEMKQVVHKYRNNRLTLLAQKIETREEFQMAQQLKFDYYQGYFFEKPLLITDKSVDTSRLNYFRLINEINKIDIDFVKVANIIKLDTALTYQLLKTMNKVGFARLRQTKDIMDCILRMGEDNLRNWLLLIITRRFNKGKSDEIAKYAYIRGMFMEQLMKESTNPIYSKKSKDGYLVGMFSMLPMIADMSMQSILDGLDLGEEINGALLGTEENELKLVLDLVRYYDHSISTKPTIDMGIDTSEIARIYTDCIFAGDVAFRTLS